MAVEIDGVGKRFEGRAVLRDVRYTVEDGSVTCVMGPSGCGKTTLFAIIMGLLAPDEGQVRGLEGRRIGPVFQENRLLPGLSVRRNLLAVLPRGTRTQTLAEHMRAVELPDSCLGARVGTLSGGMRRRVAIVRAVLYPCELLLMDEPMQGMDAHTRSRVLSYLLAHRAGRTLLLSTHHAGDVDALGARLLELPLH